MTRRWKIFGRGQVKRRIGQCPTRDETLQLPKRKRAKTYCTIMAMNNLMRLHAKKDWTNYHIKCLDDGTYEPADPFTWEHFAAITDADSCNADAACSWCTSFAVANACNELADARALPSAVFVCSKLTAVEEFLM